MPLEPHDLAFFATPAELRAWLVEHHATETELWIGRYKKGTGKASVTWSEIVDQVLCFGWIDGQGKRIDDEVFAQRITPRKPGSVWSAINIAKVAALTEAGLMEPAGLAAFARRREDRSAIYSHEQKVPAVLSREQEAARGPVYLVTAVLFAPATALTWLVTKALGVVSRKSPQEFRMVLARRELADVLEEGHDAGVLKPSQQALIQGTFALAGQPVRQFATPPGRYARITTATKKEEVLRMAKRQLRAMIPVEEPRGDHRLSGYVRVIDLVLDPSPELPPLRPLVTLKASDTYLSALERLLAADRALGHVVDERGQTIGFITARQLTNRLLKEHEA